MKRNPPALGYSKLGYTRDWPPKFRPGQTVAKTIYIGPLDIVIRGKVLAIRRRGEGRLGSTAFEPHYDVQWERVSKKDEARIRKQGFTHEKLFELGFEDRIPERYLMAARATRKVANPRPNPTVSVRSSSGSFNLHAATRHEAERVAERMRKEHSRRGLKAKVSVKNPYAARVWKLVGWGRDEGYPATVPLKSTHWEGAWDYSGPVWDGTVKQKSGGVFATFSKEGKQSYQGGATPSYRLEGT